MKKRIAALMMLTVFAVATLASCGKEEGTESESSEEVVSDESIPDEVASLPTEGADESETSDFIPATVDYSAFLNDEGYIEGLNALEIAEIPDFSTWTFNKEDLMPNEIEVQAQIDNIMSSQFGQNVTGAIEADDVVSINYIGSLDGEVFDSADNQTVTAGSEQYVGGFLTKIIGHEVGETFDIQVTFPDSYPNNTDLEGKETTFQVTINSATRAAELTDEFVAKNLAEVQDFFGSDSIMTAQDVTDFLNDYYFDSNLNGAIFDKLNKETVCDEVPEAVVGFAKNQLEVSIYGQYGKTLDEFAQIFGMSEEMIDEQVKADAKLYLLFQAIAEQQEIKVTDEMLYEMVGSQDISNHVAYYGRGYMAHCRIEPEIYDYIKSLIEIK